MFTRLSKLVTAGGTIYGDGRIVMTNGQTIYPNSNGQYGWGSGNVNSERHDRDRDRDHH